MLRTTRAALASASAGTSGRWDVGMLGWKLFQAPFERNEEESFPGGSSWRWDAGEYAVTGTFHADWPGISKQGKNGRAGEAAFGYKPWREEWLADRVPHVNGNGSLLKVAAGGRKNVEAIHKTHIARSVTPRTFTPEELEQAQWDFKTNEHRRMFYDSVPVAPFYYEKNWRKHYNRAYKKERAAQDVQNVAKWALPGGGGVREKLAAPEAPAAIKA